MNVGDLKSELARRAEEVGQGATANARLAQVHERIAARRRATVASAVGAATLAALVAVVATSSVLGRPESQSPVAPATQHASPSPDVKRPTSQRYEFPPLIDGNELIAAKINQPGETTITWRLRLDDLDVLVSEFCDVPPSLDDTSQRDSGVMATWAVNGDDFAGQSCSSGSVAGDTGAYGYGNSLARNVAVWRDAGVRPGQPFTITMRLSGGQNKPELAKARFGLGLYARTGEVVTAHGVTLPVVREGQGYGRFRLVDYRIQPVSQGHRLSMTIPASDEPLSVTFGWSRIGTRGRMVADLDGEPYQMVIGGGVATDNDYDSSREHVLTVKARGNDGGALMIAYYRSDPVD
jgi:hypothetical protein